MEILWEFVTVAWLNPNQSRSVTLLCWQTTTQIFPWEWLFA
jgi:hypothetical protein